MRSDLDEGFFVLLILLVPAALTVLVFAVVAVVAQAVKRRSLVKSAFNVGQVVTSAGIAALVFVLLHGADESAGYVKVGAALVGALCYLVVNTGAIASILSTLGTPWRETVLGGIGQAPSLWPAASASPSRPRCCWPISPSSSRRRGAPPRACGIWGMATPTP